MKAKLKPVIADKKLNLYLISLSLAGDLFSQKKEPNFSQPRTDLHSLAPICFLKQPKHTVVSEINKTKAKSGNASKTASFVVLTS
jgi:hypothetical protein